MKDLGATKWPEMLFGAWLVTFLFSPSEVRRSVSGGTVGNFGLTLGLSPAETWMAGNEAWRAGSSNFPWRMLSKGLDTGENCSQ